METRNKQSQLGADLLRSTVAGSTTNADIVFVIDATGSMQPVINTVKDLTIKFYARLKDGLRVSHKTLNQCRVKVIAYRDYYCDGEYAMAESDFFYLPEETEEFSDYVSQIEAKGGGDTPENGLEALGLAMKSDWVRDGQSKRHIVVLFTDAPAHALEKAKDVYISNYPEGMPGSYEEMLELWNGGASSDGDPLTNQYAMDTRARRLVLFAPDAAPWNDVAIDFEQCINQEIQADEGGEDISSEAIINLLSRSV